MGTDVTVPLAVDVFNKIGADRVFDREKIALVNDHFVPAKDIQAAGLSKPMRELAVKYDIKSFFEVGRSGICHCIVPDSGLVVPCDLIIGADSHLHLPARSAPSPPASGAPTWPRRGPGENWFKVRPRSRWSIPGSSRRWWAERT